MERLTMQATYNTAAVLVYQPGNGTRYEVLFCKGNDTFLFGWLNGTGTVHEFRSGGLLHYQYLMEKLKLRSPADAAALLTLIQELTGREPQYPEGFDRNGNEGSGEQRN